MSLTSERAAPGEERADAGRTRRTVLFSAEPRLRRPQPNGHTRRFFSRLPGFLSPARPSLRPSDEGLYLPGSTEGKHDFADDAHPCRMKLSALTGSSHGLSLVLRSHPVMKSFTYASKAVVKIHKITSSLMF